MTPIQRIASNLLNMISGRVNNEPLPVVILQEKSGVGLFIVLNPKLHKNLILYFYPANQILNDSILTPLGEYFELIFLQLLGRRTCNSHLSCFNAAERLLYTINSLREVVN